MSSGFHVPLFDVVSQERGSFETVAPLHRRNVLGSTKLALEFIWKFQGIYHFYRASRPASWLITGLSGASAHAAIQAVRGFGAAA